MIRTIIAGAILSLSPALVQASDVSVLLQSIKENWQTVATNCYIGGGKAEALIEHGMGDQEPYKAQIARMRAACFVK